MLEPKILVALLFIILSFVTIFSVKTYTSTLTTLIINHLVLILFLSLTITNYNSFKEVVLTLIAYLMAVLFLITNYNNYLPQTQPGPIVSKAVHFKKLMPICVAVIVFVFAFYTTKICYTTMKDIRESKMEQRLVENATSEVFDVAQLKRNRLKKKLSENFLLKRSSDVILLIVAISSSILLLRSKNSALPS